MSIRPLLGGRMRPRNFWHPPCHISTFDISHLGPTAGPRHHMQVNLALVYHRGQVGNLCYELLERALA